MELVFIQYLTNFDFIFSDKYKRSKPTIVQLAKGSVEEVKFKSHDFCLKLTSTLQGERSIYLSFTEQSEYNKWFKKCKKVCLRSVKMYILSVLSNIFIFCPDVDRRKEIRLIMLYKKSNKEILIPADTRTTSKHVHQFLLRTKNTNEYKYSFFPLTTFQWNRLPKAFKLILKLFEGPPLGHISIYTPIGVSANYLFRFRFRLMSLDKC